MEAIASQITSVMIVYSTVYLGADQGKHQRCVTSLCTRNSPVTGEFIAQMASNAENVAVWWRHHDSETAHYLAMVIKTYLIYNSTPTPTQR